MSTPFGEREMFFSTIISKEAISVTLQTPLNLIKGQIHIQPGERLKDSINQAEPFMAITNAIVLNLEGDELYRSEFVAVNRANVIWLLPDDKIVTDDN